MNTLESIIAGFATTGQGAGPMIVTERSGIFAKHGLEVEIRLMHGAVNVCRGLMSRELQFGNMAAPALLRACLSGGADLVFLTGGINQQFVMGRPGLTDRKQLAGGKIGFARDGGLNDLLVNFIVGQLATEGIGNIHLAEGAGSSTERTERLVKGELDAEIISPPEAMEAKRRRCPILIDFAEYGFNFALGGIAALRSYIENNADTVRRFITAYVEGMHRYRTDRDFSVQVQQEYSGIADRKIAEETFDITSPGMPKVPYPNALAIGKALKVLAKDIPQASTADPHAFVDDRFVKELDEGGFIAALYKE